MSGGTCFPEHLLCALLAAPLVITQPYSKGIIVRILARRQLRPRGVLSHRDSVHGSPGGFPFLGTLAYLCTSQVLIQPPGPSLLPLDPW